MRTVILLSTLIALAPLASAQQQQPPQTPKTLSRHEVEVGLKIVGAFQEGIDRLRDIVTDATPRTGIVFDKDRKIVDLRKGPAADAGIQVGDVLSKVDGRPIDALVDLGGIAQLISQTADPVSLTVLRSGAEQTFSMSKRSLAMTGAPAQDFLARLDSAQQEVNLMRKRLGENSYTIAQMQESVVDISTTLNPLNHEIVSAAFVPKPAAESQASNP